MAILTFGSGYYTKYREAHAQRTNLVQHGIRQRISIGLKCDAVLSEVSRQPAKAEISLAAICSAGAFRNTDMRSTQWGSRFKIVGSPCRGEGIELQRDLVFQNNHLRAGAVDAASEFRPRRSQSSLLQDWIICSEHLGLMWWPGGTKNSRVQRASGPVISIEVPVFDAAHRVKCLLATILSDIFSNLVDQYMPPRWGTSISAATWTVTAPFNRRFFAPEVSGNSLHANKRGLVPACLPKSGRTNSRRGVRCTSF